MNGLVQGSDGKWRCWWGTSPDIYVDYHDTEWGRPVLDDDRLYEKMCLEGFQAGLSWLTILNKRKSFRAAFAGFRIADVAAFDERDVDRLLADAGIVRHRGKIEAAIGNARVTRDLGESLTDLIWSFAPPRRPQTLTGLQEIPAITPESTALSTELRRRGYRFVGPTTMYALMQSAGLVDDHVQLCHRATRETAVVPVIRAV